MGRNRAGSADRTFEKPVRTSSCRWRFPSRDGGSSRLGGASALALHCARPRMIGQLVSHYRLIVGLGSGGMGVVCLCLRVERPDMAQCDRERPALASGHDGRAHAKPSSHEQPSPWRAARTKRTRGTTVRIPGLIARLLGDTRLLLPAPCPYVVGASPSSNEMRVEVRGRVFWSRTRRVSGPSGPLPHRRSGWTDARPIAASSGTCSPGRYCSAPSPLIRYSTGR